MGKIGLIIKREYTSRVRKKSFIVMTLLAPLLLAGIFTTVIYLMVTERENQVIEVVDETGILVKYLESGQFIEFRNNYDVKEKAVDNLYKSDFNTVLYIPRNFVGNTIQILSKNQPSVATSQNLKRQITNIMEDDILYEKCGLTRKDVQSQIPPFAVETIEVGENGEKVKKSDIGSYAIGFGLTFFIYMFIFMYGVQVMRGVIEEKTSRIVEVIISSVKPVQLMFGKIIGIGLVSITQFFVWIILGTVLVTAGSAAVIKSQGISPEELEAFNPNAVQQSEQMAVGGAQADILEYMSHIDFGGIISSFLVFFIGGYLLYSAIFAAIGSAVDNETDTQQFMMPVSLPLIGSFILSMSFVVNDPNGLISKVISIFPLTSPIAMMVRLPYGVPPLELYLSMGLLILTAIGITFLAARIYRTGILMYGKKATFMDLFRWMRRK